MEMGIQYTKYAGPPMKNSSVNSIVSTIYRQIDSTRSVEFKLYYKATDTQQKFTALQISKE